MVLQNTQLVTRTRDVFNPVEKNSAQTGPVPDRRKTMHLQISEMCLEQPGFMRTVIPTASAGEKMGLTRAPVAAPLPAHPAAMAFAALGSEVAVRLGIQDQEEDSP